jgi:oligopeptide/dipeptide ABC transporter ATP-binding protein
MVFKMSSIPSGDSARRATGRSQSGVDVQARELLQVRDLHVHFKTYRGVVHALNGVNLNVRRGEILGLVGETGSGKSVTAYSVLRLIAAPGSIVGGEIIFEGQSLLNLPEATMQRLRGSRVALIPQSPRASLNPLFTLQDQMVLFLRTHQGLSTSECSRRSRELVRQVGIADPDRVLRSYPHELSTGMCQRVLIGMALSSRPALLIADEPTTGLDVTIQAQILRLFRDLVREMGSSALLISHDLGVVAETCDRVAVMYAGRIAEIAPTVELFTNPRHPYSRGLLAATLRVDKDIPTSVIPGVVPSLLEPPRGCMFRFRCEYAREKCEQVDPDPVHVSDEHLARCHFALELPRRALS